MIKALLERADDVTVKALVRDPTVAREKLQSLEAGHRLKLVACNLENESQVGSFFPLLGGVSTFIIAVQNDGCISSLVVVQCVRPGPPILVRRSYSVPGVCLLPRLLGQIIPRRWHHHLVVFPILPPQFPPCSPLVCVSTAHMPMASCSASHPP